MSSVLFFFTCANYFNEALYLVGRDGFLDRFLDGFEYEFDEGGRFACVVGFV